MPVELPERLPGALRIHLRVSHGGPDILVPHQIPQHQRVHAAGAFGPEGVPELVERHGLAIGPGEPLGVPVEEDAGHRIAQPSLSAGEEGTGPGTSLASEVTPEKGLRLGAFPKCQLLMEAYFMRLWVAVEA